MTTDDLNRASEADFIAVLGAIYEHSPWIAARAAAGRPFADIAALQAAMAKVVANANDDEQTMLVAAHPDLAGRLARAGALAPSSADEQASLGLDRLSDEEYAMFESLNTAYRQKFGFPFVIAVRNHTRNSVLAAFETRLRNDPASERQTALREIHMIAGFRLKTLLEA